jgi:hypothetical protein
MADQVQQMPLPLLTTEQEQVAKSQQDLYQQAVQNNLQNQGFNQYGGGQAGQLQGIGQTQTIVTSGTAAVSNTLINPWNNLGGGAVNYPGSQQIYNGPPVYHPPVTPSLQFTIDMIFASVEKHLRSVIREEIKLALRPEADDRPDPAVLVAGIQSGEGDEASRPAKAA